MAKRNRLLNVFDLTWDVLCQLQTLWQWMNGGTGGAVCTRTLVYSTAAAKWAVA